MRPVSKRLVAFCVAYFCCFSFCLTPAQATPIPAVVVNLQAMAEAQMDLVTALELLYSTIKFFYLDKTSG